MRLTRDPVGAGEHGTSLSAAGRCPDIGSRSATDRPVFAKNLRVTGLGAVSTHTASSAPTAKCRNAARGRIQLGRVVAAVGAGLLWGTAVKASASEYQGTMRRYSRNNKAMRPPGFNPRTIDCIIS